MAQRAGRSVIELVTEWSRVRLLVAAWLCNGSGQVVYTHVYLCHKKV